MSSIETICRSASALSDVQIHILKNSEDLLQFASDLSHRELLVFVPGQKAGTVVLAAQRLPLLQPAETQANRKKPEQSAPGTKNRSCCRYCRRGR